MYFPIYFYIHKHLMIIAITMTDVESKPRKKVSGTTIS